MSDIPFTYFLYTCFELFSLEENKKHRLVDLITLLIEQKLSVELEIKRLKIHKQNPKDRGSSNGG